MFLKKLVFYVIVLLTPLALVFFTGCETDDDDPSTDEITVKFANRFDSEHALTGFWLKKGAEWEAESLIPSGKTLTSGKYFVFHLPNTEEHVNYRIGIGHDAESVVLDQSSMGTELGVSTFVGEGNTRYATIRVVGDTPRVTFHGCSTIGGSDFWDDDYEQVEW